MLLPACGPAGPPAPQVLRCAPVSPRPLQRWTVTSCDSSGHSEGPVQLCASPPGTPIADVGVTMLFCFGTPQPQTPGPLLTRALPPHLYSVKLFSGPLLGFQLRDVLIAEVKIPRVLGATRPLSGMRSPDVSLHVRLLSYGSSQGLWQKRVSI